ncbi:metal-sulfur cluster biosynthetic enzyme [Rhizobium ruizarguesonis]
MSLDESEQKIDVREGIVHSSIPADELARLSDDVISALKTVYDPEIPADIFELGLIYKIDIEDDRMVKIMMTLTAPGCPVAGEMPGWVENAVGAVEGVSGVEGGHDFRSAVDAGPHVGRGTGRRRLVLTSRGIDPFTSGYYI